MVEEELTLHQEEGEVVQCPTDYEEAADLVVGPYRRCDGGWGVLDLLFIKIPE